MARIIGHEEEKEILEAVSNCEKCGKKFEEFITSTAPEAEIEFCESCVEKIKVINEKWKDVKIDICGWPAKTRTEASAKRRKVIFGVYEEFLKAKRNCSKDSDCSECPFGQIEDRCILQELQIERDNGWIPCKVRLPEEYGEYLCCDKHGEYILGYPYKTDFSGTGYMVENETEVCYDITAWQPLPKKYTKKKEENNQ